MELRKIVDSFALGQLLAEDLPAIAMEALESGYDSPSLRQLAVAEGDDSHHLRALFSNALAELGIALPSSAEAALSVARSIAESVLSGSITPYAGAKRIWDEVYVRFPALKQLRPFVGLASEYEDDEKRRADYANQILDKCKSLVSAG